MSEWKTYKLCELCKITSSKRIFANEYTDFGVPFYRGKEIIEKQKGNRISTELFITQERYDEIKMKYGVPQIGDMLLTSVGTLGIPYIVEEEMFYFKDGNLTWFYDFDELYSRFLYYWFLSPIGKANIDSKAIGSTQKALTIATLSKFEISLPPLTEQKRIADILSAIDDKIELNRRINANLEQQAQALYKSWFVDFEFPNEEGKPYKSSGGKMQESELGLIPKGWNIDKLGNKVVIKRGGSPRPIQDFLALKGLRWLKISDATAEPSPYIYKIKEFIKEEGLSKTVFLNKGELVLSNSATPGLPKLLGLDTCIHDGWLYFPKSDFSKEYLFELFLFEREKILSQANGSVFSNLKTDILKALTIIVPQENVLNRFQNIIGQIFRSIQQKQEEIISLTTLRDTLLPKLMSGEITV